MKKRIPIFLAGMVTMAVLLSFAMPALAAANEFLLNQVNVALHGKQVAAIGEDYTLANGDKVPYSISYKGTTYLPIRKVGELVNYNIYWDDKTGTAGIGNRPYEPQDYSSWTAEKKASYEEFMGMWDMKDNDKDKGAMDMDLVCKDGQKETLIVFLSKESERDVRDFALRFFVETRTKNKPISSPAHMNYRAAPKGKWLWSDNYDWSFDTDKPERVFSINFNKDEVLKIIAE